MADLIVSVLTSLDGAFEAPGRDLTRMPFEDAFNDHNLQLLRGASTLVYGGRWFSANWQSWAAIAADDTANPRDREIASFVTTLPSLVISDSFVVDPAEPWAATTRVVRRADATGAIADLKTTVDGDLVVFGSGTTWNPLLDAGQVDQLIVLVGAGLTGGGSPLYTGPGYPDLRLVDAERLPGSDLVRLRYATR